MKWPFRRRQDVSAVPAEIQEYYQTERRERTGIAWLLALGTLIITIGLATLLFFGGRWAYRAIVDNSQETAQTDQGQEAPKAPEGSAPEKAETSTGTSSTNTSTPSTPAPSTTSTPSSGTQGAATTPAAGELPNTGAGDVIALFAATTVAASAAHYAISTRRTES